MAKKPRNKQEANEAKKASRLKEWSKFGPKWGEYAQFLRKVAVSYRMMGDLEMASYLKRQAQRLER